MARIRKAAICIPTRNGASTIGRVLGAVLAQDSAIPYDVTIVDTESDDGTVELAAAFPVRLRRIRRDEFDHGDTRNLAASITDGDAIVFLTQDAIPADQHWLAALLEELEDERTAGAYSRNLAPPGSSPLTELSLRRNPCGSPQRREQFLSNGRLASLDPTERRLLFDFNDVSSCIRRSLWERFPFPRTMFGEDVLWARGAIEAGWRIVYTPRSRVFHGHDDPPRTAGERAAIDGRFNREHLGRVCIGSFPDAVRLGVRLAWQDSRELARADAPRAEKWRARLRAPALRLSETVGLWRGGLWRGGLWRGGRTRALAPPAAPLEKPSLRILYVVHGFPPESFAGTEIYARELALEMVRRGHEVGVFHRSVRTDQPDLSMTEESAGGLKLFRFRNDLRFAHAGESYAHGGAEERFREALDRFHPEVVHFQHLIHTSATLVPIARAAGAATVVTLHDYWLVCPRVQCFRPGGALCGGRKELGCLLCVKEKGMKWIDVAAAATRALRPAVEFAVRRIEKKLARGATPSRLRRDFAALYRRDRTLVDSFAGADLLISPSRFLRDFLLERVPELDPRRVVLSDNGLRTEGLQPRGKRPDPAGRVRVGFIGSLVPYKGIETAVDAMRLVEDPRAVLLVFGVFEPERDPFHARLRERAQGMAVEFRGAFDHRRLPEVLSEIDFLVVPSTWYENAPLTIREAHLAATPAIVSDLGGMAESVRPGVDGLTFRTGDAADLASVIRRLAADPSGRAALASDFLERKTMREDGGELEFRYRGLLCRRRA